SARTSKIKIWIAGTRPKTLPAAIAPVIMGLALALYDTKINIPIAVFTIIAALLIQIGTNLANDYFDFVKGTDTDKRIGPVRLVHAGLVKKKDMLAAFIITFALAIIFGAFLVIRGGYPVLIIGFLAIIFGILYTAGPAPIGYIGLGDLFVFIFFGLISITGTYYLQVLKLNYIIFIASIAPGLFSTAILAANNIRDLRTDKEAGKKTLIVKFGYNFGVGQYLFCVITAHLIPVVLVLITRAHYFSLIAVLTIIMAVKPVKLLISRPGPESLIPVLGITSQMLLLFSIIFSIGWNIRM
ncbi:MAG: 1,4-dihydroxy-2-naphthoate polyprenyltransferase, partial [Actinobacteria bacterium]|nr:1,4-dihydroxy-2-naphthoate polyprenyltransferase [Actinomycetota bacterium]